MAHYGGPLADIYEEEEFHVGNLKHLVVKEGCDACFEIKVYGTNITTIWYHNGKEMAYNPRLRISVHGKRKRLYIRRVKRSDSGVYTVIVGNDVSVVKSQATLTVKSQRPNYLKTRSAIYLTVPTSDMMRIKTHLKNTTVKIGEPIRLKVEINKDSNVSPDYLWFKNHSMFSLSEEGTQSINHDHSIADYVKYNSLERDSGVYTVLIVYSDTFLSSTAEVVVMRPPDPLSYSIPTNETPFIIQHLPEEYDAYESQEISLFFKAEVSDKTSVHWLKNGNLIDSNHNIQLRELEGRGNEMKILKVNPCDAGVYKAVVRNDRHGTICTTKCEVTVSPLPPLLPRVEVVQPLKLIITSLGAELVLYCCFSVPKNLLFDVVWRIGLYKVVRSTSKFQVAFNKMGMQMLLIRCVDPDMLGEVSCELRFLTESRKFCRVAFTKGMLVHVPPNIIAEDSFGEFNIWTEQLHSEIQTTKTTVIFKADRRYLLSDFENGDNKNQNGSTADKDEEGKLDEAVALAPREVSRSIDKLNGVGLTSSGLSHLYIERKFGNPVWVQSEPSSPARSATKGPGFHYEAIKNSDSENILMDLIYCRLNEEDSIHFLMIQNCKRDEIHVIVQTKTVDDGQGGTTAVIIIEWIDDVELPSDTWFSIDSALAPKAFYHAGFTSKPQIMINLPHPNQIIFFRVKLAKPPSQSPEVSFVLVPPHPTKGLPQNMTVMKLKSTEEFKKDYTIVGPPMGMGAYGAVYLARNKIEGLYAAKVVKTRTEKRRQSTLREVELMKRLQHRRIIELHAAFFSREQYIIVMEYLSGGELFERIVEEDYFEERTAVHYIHQICEGLEYLHSQKIVHLDIKPENVVCVSRNSRDVKIVDFGLSRVLENNMTRAIYGTRDYIAPEVLNFEAITTASDMWSLGVVTYVMLSGTIPFAGTQWPERAANITKGSYTFDEPAFDTVSDGAKNFINSLLLLDPDDRLTAVTARQHPWMNGPAQESGFGLTGRWKINLLTYLETNKARWQRAGNVVIAANRLLVGVHRCGHRLSEH